MRNTLILFLFLIISGCQTSNTEETEVITPFTFLALGDSYTIGESVDEQDRYPNQLVKSIKEQGIAQMADARITATTGWTVEEMMAGMDDERYAPSYDMVTLLIGVNNQYRGNDVEVFREAYKTALQRAINLAGGDPKKVLVLSIPDWGVMPFAEGRDRGQIASEIDIYNAVKKEETELRGVKFIDITPISRRALNDDNLVASDGLHPSGEMYALWVQEIIPEVRSILVRE